MAGIPFRCLFGGMVSSDIVVMGLMFGWKDGCTAPEH